MVKGAGASGKGKTLAKDTWGEKTARHDGHGGGMPHYQHKNGGKGHIFYGIVTFIWNLTPLSDAADIINEAADIINEITPEAQECPNFDAPVPRISFDLNTQTNADIIDALRRNGILK